MSVPGSKSFLKIYKDRRLFFFFLFCSFFLSSTIQSFEVVKGESNMSVVGDISTFSVRVNKTQTKNGL